MPYNIVTHEASLLRIYAVKWYFKFYMSLNYILGKGIKHKSRKHTVYTNISVTAEYYDTLRVHIKNIS